MWKHRYQQLQNMFHLPVFQAMCLISTERAGVLITYSSPFQIKCSRGKKITWILVVCVWEWNELCLRLWMRVMLIHAHITQAGSGSGLSCSYLLCECPCAAFSESNERLIDSCCLWAQWGSSTHNILLAARLLSDPPPPPPPPSGGALPINLNHALSRSWASNLFRLPLPVSVVNSKTIVLNLPLPVWKIMRWRICPSLSLSLSCFLCISNSAFSFFFQERVYHIRLKSFRGYFITDSAW